MIGRIIIISILLFMSLLLVICGAIDEDYGSVFWGLIMSIFFVLLLIMVRDAKKYNNIETVTYEFPAENYKIEKRVMVSFRDTLIDGSQYQVVDTSTVYVLTGTEPILVTKENKNIKVKTRTVTYE